MTARPIAEGLFTADERPRLIAGSCRACGTATFPRQESCPRCTGQAISEHLLPVEGRLWTWTIQRFAPKPPYVGPEPFVPYGVGYVEFAGECIVEGRLTTADPTQLAIGQPMRTASIESRRDPDGTVVTTYAFEPIGARA